MYRRVYYFTDEIKLLLFCTFCLNGHVERFIKPLFYPRYNLIFFFLYKRERIYREINYYIIIIRKSSKKKNENNI